MKTLAVLNPENISEEKAKTFEHRVAVRSVLFNEEGKIAFLRVNKDNYHKLPGGGVEEGESIKEALEREIKEEVGCKIEIGDEIGKVIEYRGGLSTLQESQVFFGKVAGGKCEPEFDEFEREKGFELIWVYLDEAVELLKKDEPEDYNGSFIVKRDLLILEGVRGILK